tara:strand:+ start:722 stop:1717 length:996 start_codon:yes stop_codon:yes gene_type:complete
MDVILVGLFIIVIVLLIWYLWDRNDDIEHLNRMIAYENYIPRQVERELVNMYVDRLQDGIIDHFLADRVIDIEQERVERNINDAMLAGRDEVIPNILAHMIFFTNRINNNRLQPVAAKQTEKWRSDSQNVHDSNISVQISDQYKKLKQSNDLENITIDLNQLMECLSYKVNPKVMAAVRSSNHNNIPERLFIYEVWRRSLSKVNTKNADNIQTALITALNDCLENKQVVCSRGRVARIMGSLAVLDPVFGDFKTKQVIRNEFMEKCGHVINKHVNSQSSELQKKYINDEKSPEVDQLKNELHKLVIDVAKEYKHLHSKELQSYIELAKAEI